MIRSATLEDIPALMHLERTAFDRSLHHEYANARQHFHYILTKANAEILVYSEHGRLCGAAEIFYRKHSRAARLYSLAVLPECQGRGIGKRLLHAVDDRVKQRGLKAVTCESRMEMVEHYKAFGYVPVRVLKRYYPNDVDGMKLYKAVGG